MAETPFIIHEHQFQKIKAVLARLGVESVARVVFLVDRDGQPIAFHGDIGNMDTTSFSSLAAGNVAATTSMAKLIGEANDGADTVQLRADADAFPLGMRTDTCQSDLDHAADVNRFRHGRGAIEREHLLGDLRHALRLSPGDPQKMLRLGIGDP